VGNYQCTRKADKYRRCASEAGTFFGHYPRQHKDKQWRGEHHGCGFCLGIERKALTKKTVGVIVAMPRANCSTGRPLFQSAGECIEMGSTIASSATQRNRASEKASARCFAAASDTAKAAMAVRRSTSARPGC
jgi:hypothetical protein